MRLLLDVPQPGNRIRFVRACGRGEAACLRERDSISVAGRKIPEFFCASGSGFAPFIDHSFLHGIFEIPQYVLLDAWDRYPLEILSMYGMGFVEFCMICLYMAWVV